MTINNLRAELIKKVRRVVIKIGSSVLTDSAININFNAFAGIVDQIAWIKGMGLNRSLSLRALSRSVCKK